jgi:hypothetical protein
VSQAHEDVQRIDPGKAVVRRDRAGQDAWADLRPAFRWFQRRRPVRLIAIVLIAAQVAWRAQFLAHMFFYRQDFFNLDFAIRSPFSWHYLTYVGTGHLMIGQRAIIWVLVRISLYNWTLASAVSLAIVAAAGLAAFAVLRTLFGERPAILIPLAVYLLTPLGVADVGWWTVALESVPLQLAMFMALNSHIHYVRTARRRHLAAAAGWVVVGLLAFEKGLVVPVLLFAVTSAFLVGAGSWLSGMRQALVRFWRAWLIYAAALIGYAIVLATSLGTSTTQPLVPTATAVLTFSWGLLRDSLLPGAIGGPWRWWLLPGHWYALADPPTMLIWLAFIAAAVVVVASILRRRISWRAWAILAAWVVLADMLPVIIGRLNWYPVLLAMDTHYVADAMPALAICIGLATLAVAGGPEAPASRAPAPGNALVAIPTRPRLASAEQAWRVVTGCVFVVFVVGSIWSTSVYQSRTTGQPAASYIAKAVLATESAPRGTLVLDGGVPDEIKDSTYGTRAVIGVIRPGKLTWIEHPTGTVDGLRIFGLDGRLDRVWVYGTSTGSPKPPHACWPERHGQILLRFWRSSPNLTTSLRIGYIWGPRAPGVVIVVYGTMAQELTVRHGLHTAYLSVTGPATSVIVTGLGDSGMCVGDAEAGTLQPILPSKVQP